MTRVKDKEVPLVSQAKVTESGVVRLTELTGARLDLCDAQFSTRPLSDASAIGLSASCVEVARFAADGERADRGNLTARRVVALNQQ